MKILLTGSNGLLGQKLVYRLAGNPKHRLMATSRGENRLRKTEGYQYRSLDITKPADWASVVGDFRPDVLIHTAAMTHVDRCHENPADCEEQNVKALQHLISACQPYQTQVIHLSTDFIFDGKAGPYREDDQPHPLSIYGSSKLKGEELLQESGLPVAILRTILVYGVAEELSRSNIVLWAKGALQKGDPIQVVDDQYRSPTLAEDLAEACVLAAEKKATGVFHVSGPRTFSIFELVEQIADFWQLDKELLNQVSSETLNQPAKRPPKTGFIIDKARQELGYRPHSFREGLAVVDKQLKAAQGQEA
jgi:dTDP-4-dehydrorhamnose reductase